MFSQAGSLSSMFSTCSTGTVVLDQSNSKVVGPIVMPCSGMASAMGSFLWNVTTCEGNNLQGWLEYCSRWAGRPLVGWVCRGAGWWWAGCVGGQAGGGLGV